MADDQGPILFAIGRLEGKLDGIIGKQVEQDYRLNNHGDRLAELEKSKAKLWGIAAAVSVLSSIAFKLLPDIFK